MAQRSQARPRPTYASSMTAAPVQTVRGIRYATADRFMPPTFMPFEPHAFSTERGPICPQLPSKLAFLTGQQAPLEMSEACLHLSISRPSEPGPHPVLVWIHGGAYTAGGGDLPWYDGARLSGEQRLIVVSITYRLGPFGYLRLPEASGPSNGQLDQMNALRWVRENIALFDGDPDNVTVVGQSAGAHSIAAMMAWGESRALFDRAILMSCPAIPLQPELVAQANADSFNRMLGKDPSSATVEELLRVQGALPPVPITDLRWAPVAPPPGHPAAPSLDIVAGWTRDDAFPFALMTAKHRLLARVRGRTMTSRLFERGARSIVERTRRAGARGWLYRIDFGPTSELRAGHCVDLPLILGDEQAWKGMPLLGSMSWADVDVAGRVLRKAIGSFARSGVPNDGEGELWRASRRPRRIGPTENIR
jgi:para-nitrobenzyl esterase